MFSLNIGAGLQATCLTLFGLYIVKQVFYPDSKLKSHRIQRKISDAQLPDYLLQLLEQYPGTSMSFYFKQVPARIWFNSQSFIFDSIVERHEYTRSQCMDKFCEGLRSINYSDYRKTKILIDTNKLVQREQAQMGQSTIAHQINAYLRSYNLDLNMVREDISGTTTIDLTLFDDD